MPARTALGIITGGIRNAAKMLDGATCCLNDTACALGSASATLAALEEDLGRLGSAAGTTDDTAGWLLDAEWVPACLGLRSANPYVQMAACRNTLRALEAAYEDVLLDGRLPDHLVELLTGQLDLIQRIESQMANTLRHKAPTAAAETGHLDS